MRELEPCPFCGGLGRIDKSPLSTLSWPVWSHKPGCPMNAAVMYPNRKEALKAGNTRFEKLGTITGILKALEAEAADCNRFVLMSGSKAAERFRTLAAKLQANKT